MKKLLLFIALCALSLTVLADGVRLGKPLFVEDVTNEGGLLNNIASSGQVASVSLQVAGADSILRAFVSGEILAEAAEMLEEHSTNDVVHITAAERTAWNAKAETKPTYGWSEIANKPNFATVATSGLYSDLTGTPTIPTVPTTVSSFTNDTGYITTSDVTTELIQQRLGVYLYLNPNDGLIYVHTPEQ